ncbi:MAG: phosphoglucosamine mutase, partial [Candidatus Kapabacteria bacterium]|nr:phosphoglucosamine mutase [Candidatus Kapabacteria bacterium]
PVGEINVVRAMQEAGAIIGGEGSGGVILPHCHYGRDSLVGVALVIWLMAHTTPEQWNDLTLHSLYTILKHKQPLAEGTDLKTIIERVATTCYDANVIDTRDGIRCDWSDAWVQLRGSNTEPIVRIIAEAPTEQQAQALLKRVKEVLN